MRSVCGLAISLTLLTVILGWSTFVCDKGYKFNSIDLNRSQKYGMRTLDNHEFEWGKLLKMCIVESCFVFSYH